MTHAISFWKSVISFSLFVCLFAFSAEAKEEKPSSSASQRYIQQGEYEKAIPLLNQELIKNPQNEAAKQELINCYSQLGLRKFRIDDFASAAECFRNALNLDPESLPARQNLAVTLIKLGSLAQAQQTVEKGLQTAPKNKTLLLLLAEIYQRENDDKNMLETMQKLHQYFPDDLQVGSALANYYYSQMKMQESRRIYKELLVHHPNDITLYEAIARTYKDEENWEAALAEYQKIISREPKSIQIYREIAKIYQQLGKPEEALATYQKAAEAVPAASAIYIWLGELYESRNEPALAISNYQKAADLGADHLQPYYKLALQCAKEGNVDQARIYLRQAIRNGLEALGKLEGALLGKMEKGVSLSELKSLSALGEEIQKFEGLLRSALDEYLFPLSGSQSLEAEKELNALLRRYPRNRILLEYSGALLERNGDWEGALKIWTKLLQKNAKIKRAHLGMGKAYEAKGEWEKAAISYRKALEMDEEDKTAYKGTVRMYEKMGKLSSLIEEYQKKAKFPSYRSNVLFLGRLEELLRKLERLQEADEIKKRIEEINQSK